MRVLSLKPLRSLEVLSIAEMPEADWILLPHGRNSPKHCRDFGQLQPLYSLSTREGYSSTVLTAELVGPYSQSRAVSVSPRMCRITAEARQTRHELINEAFKFELAFVLVIVAHFKCTCT